MVRNTQTTSSTVTRRMNPKFCSLSCRSKIWFARRVFWVIQEQIAQDDVGIQTNHHRWRFVAPASIAMFISSTEIGRLSLGTLPFSLDIGILGRMATVPSG
jgi:hypothetical protein